MTIKKLYHGNITTIPTRKQQAFNNNLNIIIMTALSLANVYAIINYIIN